MRVHELIAALKEVPQDAEVSLTVCVGELENDAACEEVAHAEAIGGLDVELSDDWRWQTQQDGRVHLISWYYPPEPPE